MMRKKILPIDERLAEVFFGLRQGLLWATRCQQDRDFKQALIQHTGLQDIYTEPRYLYDAWVMHSVFRSQDYEIAFNHLDWQQGNLHHAYTHYADLMLFRNQQRIICISVRQTPNPFVEENPNPIQVTESTVYWTDTNLWLNDCLDFIRRIERCPTRMSAACWDSLVGAPPAAKKIPYRLGYQLAKWLFKHKKISQHNAST